MARAMPGLIICLLWALPPAMGQCYYTSQSVPNPPGWSCSGQAINSLGWVAGYTQNGGETYRAFVWSPEAGTIVLPLPPGVVSQQAFDINDVGHVVGTMVVTTGQGNVPFLWNGVQYVAIEMPPGGQQGFATGINNAGRIVGDFNRIGGGLAGAFLWEDGVFTVLTESLGASVSDAKKINSRGDIVGYGYDSNFLSHGFVIRNGVLEWLPEPPGIIRNYANALSNTGFSVGSASYVNFGESGYRSFGIVWTPHNTTHLVEARPGDRDTVFTSVNDYGRAVGWRRIPGSGGIVWQDGVVQDLGPMVMPADPGVWRAYDINNAGQIVVGAVGGAAVLSPVWRAGDLTGDCYVTIADLLIVLSNFGACQETIAPGDIDLDGDVDLHDLIILLSHWGV